LCLIFVDTCCTHFIFRSQFQFSIDTLSLVHSEKIKFSRAVSDGSHSTIFNRLSVVFVTIFEFLSCVFLGFFVSVISSCSSLSQCMDPQGSLHTPNHFHWWSRFMASVSRTNRPTSLKALSPYTFIHSFYFRLPGLIFFFFSCLNVIFFMYLK